MILPLVRWRDRFSCFAPVPASFHRRARVFLAGNAFPDFRRDQIGIRVGGMRRCRTRWRLGIFVWIGLVVFPALLFPAESALPQRVYLWHRAWTPSFQQAVTESAGHFAALDVLAAEITWKKGQPEVARVSPPWMQIKTYDRPVAVVVRIGPYAGEWKPNDASTRAVIEVCRAQLAAVRTQGLIPTELQLDFDAATARLASYRNLLRVVRTEVAPPRLTITSLPDWLRSADFDALVGETDGYVLQVHSLEKPTSPNAPFTLCDPVRARAWVEEAARRGRPFRVALPAYGYRVVFDPEGTFVGLEAEQGGRSWPPGYRQRLAIAEPAEIAAFVQQLLASPPRGCEGIAWFRLPSPDDELAWSWPTLRAVMAGEVPAANLVLEAKADPTGALNLTVVNRGETSVEPAAFRLEWSDARLLAADMLAGWQIANRTRDSLELRPPPHGSNGLLRPGDTLRVGWLRLDPPSEIRATLLR